MVLTVTLNPAIDKLLVLNNFDIHKLHRLENEEMSLMGPGGKGVNVAINLNFLGDSVIASGFAGGNSGHLLCDELRREGITTNFVFTKGLTRTNISILDQEKSTLTEINDFGQQIPSDDQDFFFENYKKLLTRIKYVVLAGSLPEGMDVSFYKKLIEEANRKQKKVFLHTMPMYLDELVDSSPFVFHPDMRSFHKIMGKHCDGIEQFIDVGKELLVRNKETEYVMFTHRIENVVIVARKKIYVLRPKDLKIVNMLGYADAFIAGFIHALKKEMEESEMFCYASAAGLTNIENIYKELRSVETIEKNMQRIDMEIL